MQIVSRKKKNHFVEVPTGNSAPTTRALSKCVDSMIKSGGDIEIRAKKVIQVLSKEYPAEFLDVAHDRGYVTTKSKNMNVDEVVSMMAEGNIKTRQICTIQKYMNKSLGCKVFCKEDLIRGKLKSLKIIDLIDF